MPAFRATNPDVGTQASYDPEIVTTGMLFAQEEDISKI
jgi:hypothetical protein